MLRGRFFALSEAAVTFLAAVLHWLCAAVYPLALAWAAVSDGRRLMIPNGASIAITLSFLPAALLGGVGLAAAAGHYAVGLGLLMAGLVLFSRGFLGGGDVKFLSAAGVWIGWNDLGAFLALVTFIGGGLVLAILAVRKFGGKWPWADAIEWLGDGPDAKTQPVPYGIAIGLAALLLLSRNPAVPASWAALPGG